MLRVNDCPQCEVKCQLDCGFTCNTMGYAQYCKLARSNAPKLENSHVKLRVYDGSIINVAVRKLGKIRLCIDPKDLNKAITRPHYPLPTIEDILSKLTNAKVFSVLDAQKGFWQIELDESSSFLTTFWTSFGRFRWLRMPFGISSAPEEFQRRQHEVLENLNGVDVIAEDILVYGRGETYEEALADHDKYLKALLQRARDVNLKFNKDKLQLRLSSIPYMGHLITAEGLKPDPRKTQAIQFMQKPKDQAAVQRYLGFVNYLSKFLPKLSTLFEPLRELTKKNAIGYGVTNKIQYSV